MLPCRLSVGLPNTILFRAFNLMRAVSLQRGAARARAVLMPVAACLFLISAGLACAVESSVKIEISGVEGAMRENVRAALSIPPGMVSEGEVNVRWLDELARQAPEKTAQALEPFGYFNAEVKSALRQSGPNQYILSVSISLGPPIIIGKTDVSVAGPGESEDGLRNLVEAFPLKEGDVLRQDVYEKAKGELKSTASGLGYLDAEFSEHKLRVWEKESTSQIELRLETGQKYYFGPVTFDGGDDYPEPFLRRYLSFREGDVFSYSKIGSTHLNLINSERFSDVVVSPDKQQSEGRKVPVVIHLQEAPPSHLRVGAGYGTDTGPRFTIRYRDLNVFHRGYEFESEADLAQRLQGLAAEFKMPGKKVETYNALKLRVVREDVSTYRTDLFSLEASRTRKLGGRGIATFFLRFQRENSNVGIESIHARLVLPGIRYTNQNYDDLVRPTRGYRVGFEALGTDHLLGSNMSLLQGAAEGHARLPLPWRLFLISRATVGATYEVGGVEKLPASLRFFAGGDRSVRGYGYQTLGPKDAKGNVVGGKNILVASVELERAIRQDWGVAVFFDAGNAFNRLTDITLYEGAGVGVRYYTKIGAVRLDIARQINVPDPGFHFHFNFGIQL